MYNLYQMQSTAYIRKVKENKACFSEKEYVEQDVALKVKRIHACLEEIHFPYILPVFNTKSVNIVKQPWLAQDKPVLYSDANDRRDTLEVLQALHRTNERIAWNKEALLARDPFYEKLAYRFSRFQQLRKQCEIFVDPCILDDFCRYGAAALHLLKRTFHQAGQPTLLHGDIAHHNFLRGVDGKIRLIDFDLATIGYGQVELALWIHRVLPHMNYQLTDLLEEHKSVLSLRPVAYAMILFPNEVFREWLYYFSKPPHIQSSIRKDLIDFTQAAHANWPKLWYTIKRKW